MVQITKIDTEFGRIAVMDSGGDGDAILLIHGSGYSKEVFHAQFADPMLSKYRLVAFDLAGHGESDDAPSADTYTFPGLAGAARAVIAALGLGRCVVAGWSLGGHVAIEMLDGATDLAGIAVSGTPPLPRGPLGMIRGFHFSFDILLASKARMSPAEAIRFERATLGGKADGHYVEGIMRVDERFRPSVARSMLYGPGCDQREAVVTSTIPVCLMHGGDDAMVRAGYLTSLSAPSLYRGGCQIIAGAGHAPFLDRPAAFNTLLADFTADALHGTATEPMPLRKAG